MGTRDATVTGIRKHGVSNPLGWDGDQAPDRRPEPLLPVSNPLGWDGDRNFSHGTMRKSSFLIH